MKILLKSLNYAPELTGIGKYNGEMCSALAKRGHQVTAVVAPPYYPEWSVHRGFRKYWYQSQTLEQVELLRCPLYVPKNATTLKRILHLSSFAISSGMGLFSKLFKPVDVIILVQPTLFCAPLTLLYAKLTGAKTVMHIQDYEIDALFGLGMMGEGRLAKFARKAEKWLMSKFDAVSTISLSMIENAKQKGVSQDRIIYFPNWSDTGFVTPESDGAFLKNQWGFEPEDKVVLYAGNIGNKQGLEIVLEAAKAFSQQPRVKFVLVGAGSYVEKLKQMAQDQALTNVFFMPLQPWSKVPQMLALADIHLVIQKRGAADAVLPSKLTNILSAGGHAIVTAEDKTELGRIANQHPGVYQCIEPENTQALVSAIDAKLKQSTKEHNPVARQFSLRFLDHDTIINNFVEELSQHSNLQMDYRREVK